MPGRQGLLDHFHAQSGQRLDHVFELGHAPAFVDINENTRFRHRVAHCLHALQITLAAQLELELIVLAMTACTLRHALWRLHAEGQRSLELFRATESEQ